MNDLERLKRAEESEPMAVLVIDPKELDDNCLNCPARYEWVGGVGCGVTGEDVETEFIPKWCPIKKAIGIIEPGCRVRYFGEGKE